MSVSWSDVKCNSVIVLESLLTEGVSYVLLVIDSCDRYVSGYVLDAVGTRKKQELGDLLYVGMPLTIDDKTLYRLRSVDSCTAEITEYLSNARRERAEAGKSYLHNKNDKYTRQSVSFIFKEHGFDYDNIVSCNHQIQADGCPLFLQGHYSCIDILDLYDNTNNHEDADGAFHADTRVFIRIESDDGYRVVYNGSCKNLFEHNFAEDVLEKIRTVLDYCRTGYELSLQMNSENTEGV